MVGSPTPQHHVGEVSSNATKEGLINGAITLLPSSAAVWALMKNPSFVRATNWQSRTALVIMPPLFIFAFTAERKLDHQMQEMAARKEHARSTAEWAEQKHSENVRKIAANREAAKDLKTEEQLLELYRESVAKSGVRVVPGEALGLHHKISNAFADHPFKILAGVGVPAVAWIFYGRTGQEHLQLQMKVMHTRVMGQFTVITMLLSLMGFKSYMDHYGKFITEAEADRRVEEMRLVREDLLTRLELEKAHRAEIEGELRQAHEVDVQKGQVHDKKQKKTKEDEAG